MKLRAVIIATALAGILGFLTWKYLAPPPVPSAVVEPTSDPGAEKQFASLNHGPQEAEYIAIHRAGLKTIPYAASMEAHYKQGDHFITHFGFGKQPLTWNSVVYIHDDTSGAACRDFAGAPGAAPS